MSNLPNMAGNLKCWRNLNKLVFGGGVSCPGCGSSLKENYRHGYLWCAACRRKYRPTAHRGSWLYGLKLKPRQFFLLLWAWQNKKSPDTARLLARVSYTTVQRWYGRFRAQLPDAAVILEGIVQVDESYFGRLRSKQPQVIVAGAIAPHSRHVSLRITNTRSQEVLERFVQDAVKPGSLVLTDKWYAYQELSLLGYEHEACNHSQGHFGPTNEIEGLWGILKRHLRKLYGCIPTKQLAAILREWMARQNSPWLFASPENYLRATLFHVS